MEKLLNERIEYLDSFNIVVAAGLEDSLLTKLSKYTWEKNIPLVFVQAFGLIGYLRLQTKEHTSWFLFLSLSLFLFIFVISLSFFLHY